MKVPFCILAAASMAVPLSSCSSTGGGKLAAKPSYQTVPAQVRRGVTKQESVRRILGEPDGRQLHPTGERWLYGSAAKSRTMGSAVQEQIVSTGISFIPYAGGAINSMRSIARAGQTSKPGAWVDFDHRGVVQDYTVEL